MTIGAVEKDGVFVGEQLGLYWLMPLPIHKVGIAPSKVAWYIRNYLADPTWVPEKQSADVCPN